MSDNLIGATTAIFIVSLSIAVNEPVDVAWSTRDGTAKAGTDYQAANGVVTFLPGETEKQIEVIVYGQNVSPTGDKNFFINLMPPTNAVLGTALIEAVIKVEDEAGVPVTTVIVAQGKRGLKGDPGLSAYEQAVLMGYVGTLEDWMQEQADAAAAAQRAGDYAAAAASAATKAENAATAASFLGNIFPTPEAGVDPVTGVSNGAYYNVRSPDDDSFLVEYQNIGGVPTPSGKSYPSSGYVLNIAAYSALPFVPGKTYRLNERVVLSNGDIVKSTVPNNTVDPDVNLTGWVLDNDTSQVIDLSGKTQLEINNAKSVTYLKEVFLYDGLTIKTTSYHADTNVGGNTYCYDALLSKSLHDGGKYIDPLRSFPSDWVDKVQQQNWFTAAESGTGLFVLIKSDHDICASDFGVHPELDSSYAIQSAVNYSAYRCSVYADVPIHTSETLNIPNGAGLRGDHYTHNSRSTLKSNILNYSGAGDAVRLGPSLDSARNVTLADIHLFDVLGTARMGVLAYNLIGSHIDVVTTGFEVSTVVQNYLYYINKFKIFGYNYRKNGLLIGGNINEGLVEYKLISTSAEIEVGFSCGNNNSAYGVLASASNNPKIYGSVEQHSGRHFTFQQIRGGDIRPYMESPAPSNVNYQSIQMSIGRCYGSNFNVYASGKSSYTVYADKSRDCKISGEIKGASVADLNITGNCFGIDTSELHAAKVTAANYTTGRVVGRAANGNNVRESYGAATATPTAGGYGVGSKLWYTNPTTLPARTVVTDVTLNTSGTPNTITKTTASVKLKEIGKLITVAGSFGELAATTISGDIGDTEITINTGANNVLVGDYLSIPGNSGAYKIDYIFNDAGVTKARLSKALTAAISAATVTYFAPSYEPIIVETA